MLASNDGKLIRFPESDVRAMGRTARGVRGIRLARGARVISLMIASDGLVLTATENGYGKCTPTADYRRQGRAGMGIISIRTSRRNGAVVGAELVAVNDQLMLITDRGKLVRTRVNEVSVLGRGHPGRQAHQPRARRTPRRTRAARGGTGRAQRRAVRTRLIPRRCCSPGPDVVRNSQICHFYHATLHQPNRGARSNAGEAAPQTDGTCSNSPDFHRTSGAPYR